MGFGENPTESIRAFGMKPPFRGRLTLKGNLASKTLPEQGASPSRVAELRGSNALPPGVHEAVQEEEVEKS